MPKPASIRNIVVAAMPFYRPGPEHRCGSDARGAIIDVAAVSLPTGRRSIDVAAVSLPTGRRSIDVAAVRAVALGSDR